MTCPQTAHILDLYDNFREAEIAYSQFLDRELEADDRARKQKCARDSEAEREAYKLEHEIVALAKEAARVAVLDIGPPQSGVALLTLIAVNLTIIIWDLVEHGEIDFDPSDQTVTVDSPLHHNIILQAWNASLWLAGLKEDPRFWLETITADLEPVSEET